MKNLPLLPFKAWQYVAVLLCSVNVGLEELHYFRSLSAVSQYVCVCVCTNVYIFFHTLPVKSCVKATGLQRHLCYHFCFLINFVLFWLLEKKGYGYSDLKNNKGTSLPYNRTI